MTTPQEEYRTIPLTQGQVALVDATDYDWLMQWNWSAWWNPSSCSFYAIRAVRPTNGRSQTIRMHRLILGLQPGDPRHGDHADHDTLNNRRENLRPADRVQSVCNQRVRVDNELGCKGVSIRRHRKIWRYCSQIQVNGKKMFLGQFPFTPEGFEAAKEAYRCAAVKYFGEFVFLDENSEGQRKPGRPILDIISKAETWGQRVRVDSKTKYKGVSIANCNRYRAGIHVNGKRVHLGYFPLTPIGLQKASEACQSAIDLYFGRPE